MLRLGYSISPAAYRGRKGADVLASLQERSSTVSVWNASDYSTLWQNTDGTGAVTGTGEPVGRMEDVGGKNSLNFIAAGTANRPSSTGGLYFDGVDDRMQATFAASGPANASFVCLYKGSDNVGFLFSRDVTAGYFGFFSGGDNSALVTNSAGTSPVVKVNGSTVTTRTELRTAMVAGGAVTITFTGLDLSGWSNIKAGTNTGNGTFTEGTLIPVALLDGNAADYQDAFGDATKLATKIATTLAL